MAEGEPQVGVDYLGVTTPFYCHDGDGNFLLHQRGEACRDEQGRWDPGSGQFEFLEVDTLEENVLKEILEEYCCEGTVEEQLPAHIINREHEGRRTQWLAVPFFVAIERGRERIGEPHKMARLGWFPCGDWPEPLHTGFAHTYEQYQDHFDKYKP